MQGIWLGVHVCIAGSWGRAECAAGGSGILCAMRAVNFRARLQMQARQVWGHGACRADGSVNTEINQSTLKGGVGYPNPTLPMHARQAGGGGHAQQDGAAAELAGARYGGGLPWHARAYDRRAPCHQVRAVTPLGASA